MKKKGNFTHYSIFFALLLFSTAFSLNAELWMIQKLNNFGLYHSLLEVLSEKYVKISLWIMLFLLFFMFFAALKLAAETLMELSIFVFVRSVQTEQTAETVEIKTKGVSWSGRFFLVFGLISIFCFPFLIILILLFLLASVLSFMMTLYRLSDQMEVFQMIGFVFLNFFFWGASASTVVYILLKLFNGLTKSIGL
ncbi:MAG TPA: DUF5366 family protein [Bacillota bacterium]|nr:DUF5366 family protein [Bacillota bacterium]